MTPSIQNTLKTLDELEAKVVSEQDPTETLQVIACMKINAYPLLREEIKRLQGEVERLIEENHHIRGLASEKIVASLKDHPCGHNDCPDKSPHYH